MLGLEGSLQPASILMRVSGLSDGWKSNIAEEMQDTSIAGPCYSQWLSCKKATTLGHRSTKNTASRGLALGGARLLSNTFYPISQAEIRCRVPLTSEPSTQRLNLQNFHVKYGSHIQAFIRPEANPSPDPDVHPERGP